MAYEFEREEPPFPGMVYGKLAPGLSTDEIIGVIEDSFPELRLLEVGNTALKGAIDDIESDEKYRYLPHPNNSFWHSDHAHHEEPTLATLLYAAEATDRTQSTHFIDMAAMLVALEDDGITRSELGQLRGVFSGGYYYRHVLPSHADVATVSAYCSALGVDDLNEVANSQDADFPPVSRPLLAVNPFTAADVAYFDELRMENIVDATGRIDTSEFHSRLLEYLADLEDKPYFHQHYWQPGDVVLYPHFGTLHRAVSLKGRRLLRRVSFSKELSPDSL